jgi:hypothetical protein
LAKAMWTEVGIGESGGDEVADNVSLSADRPKPHFARMVIGWGLSGGAITTAFADGDC